MKQSITIILLLFSFCAICQKTINITIGDNIKTTNCKNVIIIGENAEVSNKENELIFCRGERLVVVSLDDMCLPMSEMDFIAELYMNHLNQLTPYHWSAETFVSCYNQALSKGVRLEPDAFMLLKLKLLKLHNKKEFYNNFDKF